MSAKTKDLCFLRPLISVGVPLTKNISTASAKSVLLELRITTWVSATDAAIQKRFFGFGMTALIIIHEEIQDIRKIVKYLEELGLLIKDITETVQKYL